MHTACTPSRTDARGSTVQTVTPSRSGRKSTLASTARRTEKRSHGIRSAMQPLSVGSAASLSPGHGSSSAHGGCSGARAQPPARRCPQIGRSDGRGGSSGGCGRGFGPPAGSLCFCALRHHCTTADYRRERADGIERVAHACEARRTLVGTADARSTPRHLGLQERRTTCLTGGACLR